MAGQTQQGRAGLTEREPATDRRSEEPWPHRRVEVSRLHIGALWVGAALAVLPSLPFIQSEATAFVRLHNWAIFAAGVILGWVLANARGSLG